MRITVGVLILFIVAVSATGCKNGSSDHANDTVGGDELVLQSIQITPATKSLLVNHDCQLLLLVQFFDGSTADVTDAAIWQTSDEAVVRVLSSPGSKGVVRGLSVGKAIISAAYNGLTATTEVSVTEAVPGPLGNDAKVVLLHHSTGVIAGAKSPKSIGIKSPPN